MVAFDFFLEIASTLFFRQLSGTKFPPHKKNFVPLKFFFIKNKNYVWMYVCMHVCMFVTSLCGLLRKSGES